MQERRWPTLDEVAGIAAPGFAIVAGSGLVVSCGGLGLFDFGEPITRLTAVHFTYAGVATTVLGQVAVRTAAGCSVRNSLVIR